MPVASVMRGMDWPLSESRRVLPAPAGWLGEVRRTVKVTGVKVGAGFMLEVRVSAVEAGMTLMETGAQELVA